MIVGLIHKQDITKINIYAPNIGKTKRQMVTTIKVKIDRNKIIVGECNTPLKTI